MSELVKFAGKVCLGVCVSVLNDVLGRQGTVWCPVHSRVAIVPYIVPHSIKPGLHHTPPATGWQAGYERIHHFEIAGPCNHVFLLSNFTTVSISMSIKSNLNALISAYTCTVYDVQQELQSMYP